MSMSMMEREGELLSSSEALFDASIDSIFQNSEFLTQETTSVIENLDWDITRGHGEHENSLVKKVQCLEHDNVTLLEEQEKVNFRLSEEKKARQIQEELVRNLRKELHELEQNIKALNEDVCIYE